MKITFFIYSLSGGGAERVTAHLAAHWSKQHNVTIVTCAAQQENAYEVPEGVTVKYLDMASKSTSTLSGLVNNAKRIQKLRQYVKDAKPDVLISMMTTSNIIAAHACTGLPVKVIGSERNFPKHNPLGLMWENIRKFSYSKLDLLISQTEAAKIWLETNTNAKQVVTIKNPIVLPLPTQSPAVMPPPKGNEVLILAVGRLTAVKQFNHLIEVFSQLKDSHPQCRLVIVGAGELQSTLEKQIEELGLTSMATIQTRVGNIGDWYRYCDILAMTSFSEGFPNTLIEGMAHGKAVISYDCEAGPGEIIQHEKTGILVKPNNTEALQHELSRLVTDESFRLQLGENAKHIASELHIEKIAEQWASHFPT